MSLPQASSPPKSSSDSPRDERIDVFTLAIGSHTFDRDSSRLFQSYGRLRGDVYARQRCLIPESSLSSDGAEYDLDDPRSIHLVATRDRDNGRQVVGSLRIIVRNGTETVGLGQYLDAGLTQSEELLPVETFYPEVWPDIDLRSSTTSCEYSRYIARHPDRETNTTIARRLHRLAIQHIVNLGLPSSFAVVEDSIERHLVRAGVVLKRVSEPRFLSEYRSTNHAVKIDAEQLATLMQVTSSPLSELLKPTVINLGSG